MAKGESGHDLLGSGIRRHWMVLFLGVAGVLGAALVGSLSLRSSPARENEGRQVLYYIDPMHPAYHSDKPGKAPDCGMDLQPVYASGTLGEPLNTAPGTVNLTSDQEQAADLETETMRSGPVERTVHTAGRVAPDEDLSYTVSAGVDGWVRAVFSDRTGSHVKRGERLAAFFSRDISASQQAYLYALESYEHTKQTPSSRPDPLALATKQLASARSDLQFLGMGDAQIEELGRTRSEMSEVALTAPVDGWILERRVAIGQRFIKGELLYRVANLQHVWIFADFQPGESVLRSGSLKRAQVLLEGLPPLEARVASVLPQYDEGGRTERLRLDVNNPHDRLVPGMIVNIDLSIQISEAITVHADALIDSGTAKHVFVAGSNRRYELRQVETGWQEGDRVEIRNGLTSGERVVISGAFLLDSESRMKDPARRSKATDQSAQ